MSAPVAAVPLVTDLTPQWLTAALGREVTAVRHERIGTGQVGTCFRLHLSGDPALPATVLAKLPAEDLGSREIMAMAYTNEVRFYQLLADTVDVDVPRCFYAENGLGGTFTLLLEDLRTFEPGDQMAGCTLDQARAAAVNLAGLHGPRWCDPALLEIEGMMVPNAEFAEMLDLTYPPASTTFLDRYGDRLRAEDRSVLEGIAPLASRWLLGRGGRYGVLHMDYRADNLMFEVGGPRVSAVDWQGLAIGLPGRDLAFLLGTSLSVADRRAGEREIVAAYHARLLSYGVEDYPLAECWDDYRWGMVQGPFITVFGAVYGSRTERGDAMFLAMNERYCAALRDLDTVALIRDSGD